MVGLFGSVDRVSGEEKRTLVRSVPVKSVPTSMAPVRSTPASFVPGSWVPERFAPARDAVVVRSRPTRLAADRFALLRLHRASVAGPAALFFSIQQAPPPGR